jgi:hypothetical protein
MLSRRTRSTTGTLRTLTGELRTVESESRWFLSDGFGDDGIRRGKGAGLAARGRGVLSFEGASVEILVGQANLMVQARLGVSSDAGGGVGFCASSTGFFSACLPPHANMMHLFLPNVASTPCSPVVEGAVRGTAMFSSSWRTNEMDRSNGFVVTGSIML